MSYGKFSLVLFFLVFNIALAGCDNPENNAVKYIERGNAQFAQGDYAKARVEYKNAARIKPTDPEVRYRLGLVDEAQGDFQNAFANFLRAEQQNAQYVPAKLKLAQYFLAGEQYDQSQERLNAAFVIEPDNAEAHALLGALLLRKKDFAGTEKAALFALDKDPANITAVSVLTGLYSAQGDEAKAGEALEKGIARNPKDVSLLLLKAALYEKSMNLPKIVESYQAIFALKPAETLYRANMAAIYTKAGKLDDAEATLRAGIATQPESWPMKRLLVAFLSDNRGIDNAEKEIKDYMQANPQKDELYFWLADLYIKHNASDRAAALLEQIVSKNQMDDVGLSARTSLARLNFVKGNRELAEKLVSAVLEKDSGNREALFVRASMAYDRGYYQSAVTDLRTIIRDDPKAKNAYQLLGEALLLQGRLDLAIDTLNQLMEIDPANLPARVRLAQIVSLRGDTKRALELLSIVTKADPSYPIGWESTARIAIGAKDWTTSESAIQTLDKIEGQHLTALFLQGMMLAENGKTDEAIANYKQVIAPDPKAPLAEHALAALAALHHIQGKSAEVVSYLESLNSDSLFVATLLGESYVKLGKMTEAATQFEKVLAEKATFPEPYINRAKLYVNDNQFDQAIDVLKTAYKTAPTNLVAPMMAADLLEKRGQHKEAVALYDDILARNSGVDIAANNLAQIIADTQYTDAAALEKARQAAERFAGSSNPLMLDTLAWVYFRQGNLHLAQTVMERAMAAAGDNALPQMHYHYGAILMKTGRADLAKTQLQKAVAEGASYPGFEDAKKLLAGL